MQFLELCETFERNLVIRACLEIPLSRSPVVVFLFQFLFLDSALFGALFLVDLDQLAVEKGPNIKGTVKRSQQSMLLHTSLTRRQSWTSEKEVRPNNIHIIFKSFKH